jgi:predicted transcriptional regulator
MLMVPTATASLSNPRSVDIVDEIGSTCRICPREACAARREPSILRAGF